MAVEKEFVEIHYIKNPLYRTIHCDGAIGSMTPSNMVNVNFYSTRNTFPKSIKHDLNEGQLGEGEISPDSKTGITREIEFGVYMSKKTAKEIYLFLKEIYEDKE